MVNVVHTIWQWYGHDIHERHDGRPAGAEVFVLL